MAVTCDFSAWSPLDSTCHDELEPVHSDVDLFQGQGIDEVSWTQSSSSTQGGML